MIAPAAKDAPV